MSDLLNRGLLTLNAGDAESEAPPETTIVVTGVARGGTSMVALVLERLGVSMGSLRHPAVIEDTGIRAVLQQGDRAGLDAIIDIRNRSLPQWGFKIPSLHHFLLPGDEVRFRNPRFIIVFRDPLAIAQRNNLSMEQEPRLALRMAGKDVAQLTAFACALQSPALLVSYEKMIGNPAPFVDAIARFAALRPGREEMEAALAAIALDRPDYLFATQSIYRGQLDNMRGSVLRGWCSHAKSADIVHLELFAGDRLLGTFPAADFRADLKAAGIHLGRHAFNIDLSRYELAPTCPISASPAGRGLALPNSGKSIAALRQR